jgi:hypothetical protein
MPSRSPSVLAALWLSTALLCQAPVVTETTEFYPADVEQQHGDERWLTHRIVDAMTGLPIAGAELMLLAGKEHPLRGETWTGQRAAADGDGFVRLRVEEPKPGEPKPDCFVIRARGYGAVMWKDRVPTTIVPLTPSVPLPVQLADWQGQAVAGALVCFAGVTGPVPDLATGRTDAKGLVTLTEIDPQNPTADLCLEHPGLALGVRWQPWFPGMGPLRLQVEASPSIRGVVLDPAGKPVAEAFVGTTSSPRGPWTKTGADGSFALHGGDPLGELHVHAGKRHVVFPAWSQDAPCTLQLPKPNGKKPQVVEATTSAAAGGEEPVLVKVSIVDSAQQALGNGRFRFQGPLPARTETRGTADRDDARAFLRPGRYELWVAGDDHDETRSEVTVTADGDNDVVARPTALPTLSVQAPELPEAGSIWLRTATGSRDLSEPVRAGTPIGIPAGPCWFVLRGEREQQRVFAHDRKQAKADTPLVLPWWPATRVTGKLVDANGAPTGAALALLPVDRTVVDFDAEATVETTACEGAIDLPTQLAGLCLLLVRDPSGDRAPQLLAVTLPERGEGVRHDVGTIVLGAPPALTLRAGGTALTGTAGLVRQGWHDVRATPPQFPLGADGAFLGPRPQAGDCLLVPEIRTGEDGRTNVIDLPVRFPLSGKAPWQLTLPQGAVRLDVRDAAGNELPVGVTIGSVHERIEGPTSLRRLPAGKLRLFVAAEDHLTALVDVVVPATGTVEAKVVLKPR